MSLKEQITSDVASVFFNTDDFAELITYVQGATAYPDVVAIPSGLATSVDETEGLGTAARDMTWQIPVASLPVRPRDGDQIRRPLRGKTFVYEILPFDSSESATTDEVTGLVWVLQTKLVKEVA